MRHPVDWQTNYTDLYPFETDIRLADIQRIPEKIGVRFHFTSSRPGFSHFLAEVNNNETVCHDGVLRVLVEEPDSLTLIEYRIVISAVDRDGSRSKPQSIVLSYYSSRFYAKSSLTMKNQLILQYSDLVPMPTRVDDWILAPPAPKDIEFAGNQWAVLLKDQASDYQGIRLLVQSPIDDILPHRGTPSDAMNTLSGIEQYKRLMAGKDHAWCANLASIFTHIANSLGIPVRPINMAHITDDSSDCTFRVAEGHATTEVFLKDQNQWIWMDLTFHCLGAYLNEIGPLNLFEFCTMLNNPARRPNLFVEEYSSEERAVKRFAVEKSPNWRAYIRFFKPEQRLCYHTR